MPSLFSLRPTVRNVALLALLAPLTLHPLHADISAPPQEDDLLTPFYTDPTTAQPPVAAAPTPVDPAAPVTESFFEPARPVFAASQILKPLYLRGPLHTVDESVPTRAGRNQYVVRSEYGVFPADGNFELIERVAEVHAIARLREMSEGEEYKEALKEAAKGPLHLAQNLADDPVGTISDVPKGVFKFVRRTGKSISHAVNRDGPEEARPGEESGIKNALGVGKAKRELAAQLGVDPYSTNEVLQEELNRIARVAVAGKMTFRLGTLPIGGAAGDAITGIGLAQGSTEVLKEYSPAELYDYIQEALTRLGVSQKGAKAFVDHPYYSATLQVTMVDALKKLAKVDGLSRYLVTSLEANSEGDAIFYTRSAQLLARLHGDTPLSRIDLLSGLPICKQKDGTLLVALEWDYAGWTRQAEAFTAQVRSIADRSGEITGRRLVLTGAASPRLREELGRRGIKLTQFAMPGPLIEPR